MATPPTTALPVPTALPLPGDPAEPSRTADGESATNTEPLTGASGAEADGANALVTAGDRSFDFSLRVLTVLVLVGLVGSVSLLVYRWIEPRIAQQADAPKVAPDNAPRPPPQKASTEPAPAKEVMRDPRKVFKCIDGNRMIVQDYACTSPAKPFDENPAAEH
jgi:hypothetical protein